MARSFMVALAQAARASERDSRARARERERQFRTAERQHQQAIRQSERDDRRMEKESAAAYLAERREEAVDLTKESDAQVASLYGILTAKPRSTAMSALTDGSPETVCADVFRLLRRQFTPQPYRSTRVSLQRPVEPTADAFRTVVTPLSFLGSLFGGKARHAQAVDDAKAKDVRSFAAAQARWRDAVVVWQAAEAEAQVADDRRRAQNADAEAARQAEIERHNAGIDDWEAGVLALQPDAVVQYLTHILDSSDYPEEFAERYRAAYSPESKALVIEYVLPDPEVVPAVKEYSYNKAADDFKQKLRPRTETATIYRRAIASLVLRTIRELFAAAPRATLDTITLNGIIDTIDPATGHAVSPCVISVRTTREPFMAINLTFVDPVACLASLGASVSRQPEELAPVRPLIEFDMADRRFVAGSDIIDGLEGLDERPNIMDLSPTEFEMLVANLFTRMGLEAKLTRASRDGGVDCVAFDPRPVFGGKVVIQAKRYRHTVGVSAVRDLYGTMQHEGANKGILVTTSGYGPDAFAFAKTKPVELIDGGNLLYLLEQHGVTARIVMPVSAPE